MSATMNAAQPEEACGTLVRCMGLPGRIAVSWTAAGGLMLGGFLVAAMTLAGQLSGNALLLTSTGLFLVGGVLGYLHGAALAFFGRPEAMSRQRVVRSLMLAAIYALPTLAIGAVVAGWIAMSVVAAYMDRVLPMVAVGIAWLIGAAVVAMAGFWGWKGLRNAYARWPQRRLGTVLVAGTFAALLVLFLAERPQLWGVQMRVTEVGAVLLAAFATLWIGGPAVTLALRLMEQLRPAEQPAPTAARTLASIAIGVAVGLVLGLVALPFYGAPLRVASPAAVAAAGTAGALVVAASRAIVDEVVLRLFLVSGVAWLLLRGRKLSRLEAGALAIAAGTLAQVVLYLPGLLGIGFPTAIAGLGFVALAVVLPALAFGTLYWTRGFTTALVADATAVAVIALLAV